MMVFDLLSLLSQYFDNNLFNNPVYAKVSRNNIICKLTHKQYEKIYTYIFIIFKDEYILY